MKRRAFLQRTAAPALAALAPHTLKAAATSAASLLTGRYSPGRIANEYNFLLPGDREAVKNSQRVLSFSGGKVAGRLGNEQKTLAPGGAIGGWQLVAILPG